MTTMTPPAAPALVTVGLVATRRPAVGADRPDRAVLRALATIAPDLGFLVVPVADRLLVAVHGDGVEVRRAVALCDTAAAYAGAEVDASDVAIGEGAVEALFRLTAGLGVPFTGRPPHGEAEILGVVRVAWRASVRHGCSTPVLDQLVRAALRFGAHVRATRPLATPVVAVHPAGPRRSPASARPAPAEPRRTPEVPTCAS